MLSQGSSLGKVVCHIQLVPRSWATRPCSLWDGKVEAKIDAFYSTEEGRTICPVAHPAPDATETLGLDLGQQVTFSPAPVGCSMGLLQSLLWLCIVAAVFIGRRLLRKIHLNCRGFGGVKGEETSWVVSSSSWWAGHFLATVSLLRTAHLSPGLARRTRELEPESKGPSTKFSFAPGASLHFGSGLLTAGQTPCGKL